MTRTLHRYLTMIVGTRTLHRYLTMIMGTSYDAHNPWRRYTDFDYETHAPYHDTVSFIIFILGLGGFIVPLAWISGFMDRSLSNFIAAIVAVVFSFVCAGISYFLGYAANEAVARAQFEAEKKGENMTMEIARDVAKLANVGREMFAIKAGGNVSISIKGSFNQTITSEAKATFDKFDKDNPRLADNIATVTALLEQSKNKDAWESWMDFLDEAGKQKRPSRLSAYWDRIVKLASQVAGLAESVAKITAIFT
jgi:membrane protein YqaA with SNARE-associated domain